MMAVPDNFASHHYQFIPCDSVKTPSTQITPSQNHFNPQSNTSPPAPQEPKITPPVPPPPPSITYTYTTNESSNDSTFNWNIVWLVLIGILFSAIFTMLYTRRVRRTNLGNYDEVVRNTRISGNVRTDTTSATKTEDILWGKALFDVMKKNYPRDWTILKDYVVEQDDDRKDIVKRDEKLRQQAKEPLYKITDDKTCPVCNARFGSVGECAQHVRDAHESYGV
jgi:hypothetical protein